MSLERNYIRSLNESLINMYEDCFPVNEMAHYSGKDLNLPMNVWIDGPRRLRHSKRIKIQNNYSDRFQEDNLINVTLSDEPRLCKTFKKVLIKEKDLDKVRSWILMNKDVLLRYSEGQMSTKELTDSLKPYGED